MFWKSPRSSATREVVRFRERSIEIHRKPYRRRIGMTLQVSGRIRVSAPKSLPLAKIEEFLLAHEEWIETNMRKYQDLRELHPPKEYREGETFALTGEDRRLRFESSRSERRSAEFVEAELICRVPRSEWADFDQSVVHPEFAPIVRKAYQTHGCELLTQRVQRHAEMMGVHPNTLSFRSQKTRWGSCSARGQISLNWRLVIMPLEIIDYVVIHELAHLRFHDHSARFWGLVAQFAPDYQRQRAWLHRHQYDADFLAKRSELHQ